MNTQSLLRAPLWRMKSTDLLFIGFLVVPGLVWISNTGDLLLYIRYDVLDGQSHYLISKLVGLYAILLMWFQLVLGLSGSIFQNTTVFKLKARLHKPVGITVLSLLVLHIGLFVAAVSLRNQAFAYQLLLPHFVAGFYPLMLTLGLIGAFMILAGLLVVVTHRQRGSRLMIWIHRINIIAFVLILIHSYMIGSETRIGMMNLFYGLMAVSVIGLLFYRIYLWVNTKHLQKLEL